MVDYTLTPNKTLLKPNRGTYVDTWDVPINSDWDYIDNALGGTYTVASTSGDITLSLDDARFQQIKLPNSSNPVGTLRTLNFPLRSGSATAAAGGMWVVDNQASTQDLYVTTLAPGTNTITVKAGKRQLVFSNGTGIYFADDTRTTVGTGLSLNGDEISLTTPVAVTNGGTGLGGTAPVYQAGQLLIGKSDGTLAKAFLQQGSNITITNGDGSITIASTGGGGSGGLSSISLNSSLSGITFNPTTLNSTNTSTTIQGTLGVANGGTGTSFTALPNVNPGFVRLVGASLVSVASVDLTAGLGQVTGTLPVANGGTGTTSVTGTGNVVFATTPTITSPTITTPSMTNATITGASTSIATPTITGGAIYFGSASAYVSLSGGTFGVYSSGNLFAADSTNFAPSRSLLVIGASSTTTNLSGAWIVYSDERTKKDIQPYQKAVDAIGSLNPVSFKYNGQYGVPDDNQNRVGLIAQDVLQSKLPELIYTVPYKDPQTEQETQVYQMNPGPLVYTLINAIKELDARVKALEAKVGP